MRLINGFNAAFYINTVDKKGHKHHYRMAPQEIGTSLDDETIGDYYPSVFKFSQIISDQDAIKLWNAVR